MTVAVLLRLNIVILKYSAHKKQYLFEILFESYLNKKDIQTDGHKQFSDILFLSKMILVSYYHYVVWNRRHKCNVRV